MSIAITFVGTSRDQLGEGTLWDPLEQALYWVDIHAKRIHRHDPATGGTRSWELPDLVGSIGLAQPGHLVAALRDGFYSLNLTTEALRPLVRPEAGNPDIRFNDGKMDRQGRFLAGTMELAPADPAAGKLYRLNADLTTEVLETGVRISNALCFSPAGDRLYYADSLAGAVWAYDYDGPTGRVTNRRIFADTAAMVGSAPDGATVDAAGHLWVALVNAQQLGEFAADGRLIRTIDLPIPYPTCPSFGGAKLDVLYLSAISDSGGRLKTDHPDGGRLMAITGIGTTGLPEPRFRLGAPA